MSLINMAKRQTYIQSDKQENQQQAKTQSPWRR